MTEKTILSEKLEDNKAAAEWGIKQAELIKKGEDITRRLAEKYIPIIYHVIKVTISVKRESISSFHKSGV